MSRSKFSTRIRASPNIIREYSVCLSIPEFHPTALRKILNERQIFEKIEILLAYETQGSRILILVEILLAYETQGSRTLMVVEISNAARLRLRSKNNYITFYSAFP